MTINENDDNLKQRVYKQHLIEFDRTELPSQRVLFIDEKLLDLVNWRTVLEDKKKHFEKRLSVAPETSHQNIWKDEFYKMDDHYNPELVFNLRSISFSLIEDGLNLSIMEILQKWPALRSFDRELSVFEPFNMPFEGGYIKFLIANSLVLEIEIGDGISEVYYKEYLMKRKHEFYPEEFNSAKMEKVEVKSESNNIKWDGSKLELCELTKALFESKRIKLNGKLIQQKDLIQFFEIFFDEDLRSFHDLLRDAKTTNKWNDGKTFMNELSNYIAEFKDKLR